MKHVDWLDWLIRSFAVPCDFFAGVQPHVPALDTFGGQRPQGGQVLRQAHRDNDPGKFPRGFYLHQFQGSLRAGVDLGRPAQRSPPPWASQASRSGRRLHSCPRWKGWCSALSGRRRHARRLPPRASRCRWR